MKYRIMMRINGKWIGGRKEYDTKELAETRADYFKEHGKSVRVVPNSYFGLSK